MVFKLSLCSHGYQQRRRKLNLYFNCINRRSLSKEAESSHHRQSSSELELRSFWVDRTELIKFIHAAFSSSVSCLSLFVWTRAESLSIDAGLKLLLTNSNRLLHFPNAPHS
mmetsp:Transcript_27069/g.45871  ORF Transcript_27069/g.45871 Transcript_27069/m.45871 type:complete len:111 (-) Transcript_27069:1162-1494(-)